VVGKVQPNKSGAVSHFQSAFVLCLFITQLRAFSPCRCIDNIERDLRSANCCCYVFEHLNRLLFCSIVTQLLQLHLLPSCAADIPAPEATQPFQFCRTAAICLRVLRCALVIFRSFQFRFASEFNFHLIKSCQCRQKAGFTCKTTSREGHSKLVSKFMLLLRLKISASQKFVVFQFISKLL